MSDAPKQASVDDRQSEKWRSTAVTGANGFVVRDYSASTEDPVIMVIPASELLAVVQDIAANKRKAAIYPVGERLLDFS